MNKQVFKPSSILKQYLFTGPVLIRDKKKYMLLYKRCTFIRRTKSKKGIVWKCSASKTDDCKVFITTDDNLNVVLKKGKHTHKKPSLKTTPKHVYFTCDSETKAKKASTPKPTKSKSDKSKIPKKIEEDKVKKTLEDNTTTASAEGDDFESKEQETNQVVTQSPKKSSKKKVSEKSKKEKSLDNEDHFEVKSPKKARSASETTENYNMDFILFKSKSGL